MKIFLDCGSNIGQGFEYFRSIYGTNDIIYYLFEPDVKCYEVLMTKYSHLDYVKINNQAVYTNDTTLTFYTRDDFDVGATVVPDHNSLYHTTKDLKSYQVVALNLVRLIKDLYDQGNEIYLKLDVESSEYDILEKMIDTGTIRQVNEIYCEFHSQYMKDPEKTIYQQREKIIQDFVKENNIKFHLWI